MRGDPNQSTAPFHRTVFFFEREYWVQLYYTMGFLWRAHPGRPEGCIVKSGRGPLFLLMPSVSRLTQKETICREQIASERILSTVSGRRIKFAGKFFKGNPPGGREGRACGSPLRRQGRRTEEAGKSDFYRIPVPEPMPSNRTQEIN